MGAEENFVAKYDKFLDFLQMEVTHATPEYACVRMPLLDHHRNGMGAAHGGVISALCDAAFGCASNSDSAHGVVTISLDISFLRPGLQGPLQAEAFRVHAGNRILNYDVQVKDGEGQLIAKAMACGYVTNMVLRELISKKG